MPLPSYYQLLKFDRIELTVFHTYGDFYRVALRLRHLPFQKEEDQWIEVFGQNFDHLLDAVVLAEALAPTQEGKLEVWRKYNAMPDYLRKVANGEITPWAE
jgi:hypothetical protein